MTEFPAITICLDTFLILSNGANGPLRDKCAGEVQTDVSNFFDAIRFCVDDQSQGETTTTTTEATFFGNIFDEYGDTVVQKFTSVEELLAGVNLGPDEILNAFDFGKYAIVPSSWGKEQRKDWFRSNWNTRLHYEYGFCHTYDPTKMINEKLTVLQRTNPSKPVTILTMDIRFDVSMTRLYLCSISHIKIHQNATFVLVCKIDRNQRK